MASIISVYQSQNQPISKFPIIHCEKGRRALDAVSINKLIAEKLLDINPKRRSIRMTKVLEDVLSTLPDNVIIKDFDVMFNPNYDIDILRIFMDIRREKAFEIIWPGIYENQKLIYSEKEYRDYKEYSLSNYDLTCIV